MTIDLSKVKDGEYVTLSDLTIHQVCSHSINAERREVCLRFNKGQIRYRWFNFEGYTLQGYNNEPILNTALAPAVIMIGKMSDDDLFDIRLRRHAAEVAEELEHLIDCSYSPDKLKTGTSMCYVGAINRLRGLQYDFECLGRTKDK